jgi:hypothetical protein
MWEIFREVLHWVGTGLKIWFLIGLCIAPIFWAMLIMGKRSDSSTPDLKTRRRPKSRRADEIVESAD